eukprot:SAG31_NODE_2208_length_6187_cov_5.255749_2_plen_76_part_00
MKGERVVRAGICGDSTDVVREEVGAEVSESTDVKPPCPAVSHAKLWQNVDKPQDNNVDHANQCTHDYCTALETLP